MSPITATPTTTPTVAGLPLDEESRTMVALRTRVMRSRLDRDLIDGTDENASPEHALRATQLVSGRVRNQVADGLLRVVSAAGQPARVRGSAIPPYRPAVRFEAPRLRALAAELRTSSVEPRGVALVQRMLTDGCGPLYVPTEPGELGARIDAAYEALAPRS